MSKIINKLFKLEKNHFLIIICTLFHLSLFLNLNNKTLLTIFVFFIFIFYKRFKNWLLTFYILYILFLPFQKGKGFELVLIPNWVLKYWGINTNLPYSFMSSVTFSDIVFIGITISLIVLALRDNSRKLFQKIKPTYFLLFGFLIFNFISVINSNYPFVSFTAYLKILRYVAVCFILPFLFKNKKIRNFTPILISSSVIFQGFWATIQFLLKRPLGLSIEPLSYFFSPYGFSASEQSTFFRSTGTFDHPNTLGVFLAILLIFLIIQFPYLLKISKTKLYVYTIFLLGTLGLIFSASRASWIIFIIILSLIFLYLYKAHLLKKFIGTIPKKIMFLFITSLCIFFPVVIFPRLNQLYITLFAENQGLYYRYYLLEKAWQLSLQHPLGIGLGTFPALLLKIYGFTAWPTPVHNLFLEILVEAGFASLLLFIILILILVGKFVKKLGEGKNSFLCLENSAYFAIFTFLLLAQFYPFYLSGRIFEYFWLFLAIVI